MNLQNALLWTSVLLVWSLAWQGLEERRFFRSLPTQQPTLNTASMVLGLIFLSLAVLVPVKSELKNALMFLGAAGLLINRLQLRLQLQGPISGGSDTMTLLTLFCLSVSAGARLFWSEGPPIAEGAMAYLGLQTALSYVIAGIVKLRSSDWRRGRLLQNMVFLSSYPVPVPVQNFLRSRPSLVPVIAWSVLIFELSFALAVVSGPWLLCWMALALLFHFGNAAVLGLNRFTWAWLASYPALLFLSQLWVSAK